MLVSIDPGVRLCGVAVFEDGELASAWLSKSSGWRTMAYCVVSDLQKRYPLEVLEPGRLVIEKPQIYTQNKLKGDPNDLIDLACVVGALGVLMIRQELTTYLPRQWKGQVPKHVMIERIKGKLSEDERKRIELPSAKSLQHNVWDAVGIGLHHERKARR